MRIIERMADENKPNPLDDVTKGLGLLFRAAKTTVEKLPTERLEDVFTEGAKEVGRALETVSHVIDRDIFGNHASTSKQSQSDSQPAPPAEGGSGEHASHVTDEPPHATTSAASADAQAKPGEKPEDQPAEDMPKGPRIG